MKFCFLTFLLILQLNSSAQQLAIAHDHSYTAVPNLDEIQSNIYCEKDGDLLEVLENEKQCLDAIAFGHSLCFEGLASEIVTLINEDVYQFEGFAYFSTASLLDQKNVQIQLNIRRSFRMISIPACYLYLEN